MPEVPTRKHTGHAHKHRENTGHMQATHGLLNVGSPGFVLPAPSSVTVISEGGIRRFLIGDLLCRSQSLFDVGKGEWDPLFSPLVPAE